MGDPVARGSKTPLLSVVVPVYGVEQYLDDCLNSLVAQDVDMEIIVVIDKSPDNSVRIAKEFATQHDEVTVVENQVNVGLGAARNIGARNATGKYITFPDSDDVVPAGAYRAMVDSLEESGSDFATAHAEEFGRFEGLRRYWTTRARIFDTGAQRTNLDQNPELIADHTAWTKIFRRDFMRRHDITWPESTKCEDVVASSKAYVNADAIDVLTITGYFYRRRPGSITTGLASATALVDWARQTGEAFRITQAMGSDEAVQASAKKILTVEFPSRLSAVDELDDDQVRKAVLGCVGGVVLAASPRTLRRVPAHILERASAAFDGYDGATHRKIVGAIEIPDRAAVSVGVTADDPGAPTLSVVMPVFNVSAWVDECIGSVLAQDMGDFELIVVDDWSTDETWQKVVAWSKRDPRVVPMRNPGNGGAQARNAGIERARGEYLAFCDGDDLVPRHAYESLIKAAMSDRAEVVIGDFQKFWPTSTWRNSAEFGLDSRVESTSLMLRPRLIRNRTCWNRVFRRDFWTRHNLHFPTTPRANDIVPMTMAMALADRISVVPDVVYHYRARPGNTSMTAALGTGGSTIGYFTQERICAVMLSDAAGTLLAREYWYTALGVDGWGNLGKFLTSALGAAEEQDAVVQSVAALVALAPPDVWEAVGARKYLTYQFVAAGRVQDAAHVWRSEAREISRSDRGAVRAAMQTLRSGVELQLDRGQLRRVWRSDVLHAFLADRQRWDDEYAEEIVAFAREVDTYLNVRTAAMPGTSDARVVNALLEGDRSGAWREIRQQPSPLRVVISRARAKSMTLQGARLLENAEVQRFEAVGRLGRREQTVERVYGTWIARDEGWTFHADISGLAAGWDWTLRAVTTDKYGERKVPVDIGWADRGSRVGAVRPVGAGASDELSFRIFHSGVRRAVRAVQWRVERARKTRGVSS